MTIDPQGTGAAIAPDPLPATPKGVILDRVELLRAAYDHVRAAQTLAKTYNPTALYAYGGAVWCQVAQTHAAIAQSLTALAEAQR